MVRAALALGLFVTFVIGCGGSAPPPAPLDQAAGKLARPATNSEEDTCRRGLRALQASLRSPMQIDIHVSADLHGVGVVLGRAREVLGEVAEGSGGKIVVRTIWVKDAATRAAAEEAGVAEVEFAGPDGAERGHFGIGFHYGDDHEAIPILSDEPASSIRFWISMKIRDLRNRVDGRVTRIGVLTGTDEIAPDEPNLVARDPNNPKKPPSMQGIVEQAFPYYQLVPVDLRGGEAPIDPKLAGLLVTQPGRDLTEAELRRIDEFLLRGGKTAAVLASAVNVRPGDASMTATLDTHGVEQLLAGYGIEMKKEALLDWGSTTRIEIATQTGQPIGILGFGMPLAVHDEEALPFEQGLDDTFIGFFRLREVAMPFASPLVLHPKRQPEATLRVVARSTLRTTVDPSETIDLKFTATPRPRGEYGPRVLAATVEGNLRSAFDPSRSAAARLLVISSAQFLANPYARAGNVAPGPGPTASLGDEDLQLLSMPYAQKYLTPTILAFKTILDWMTFDDDLRACIRPQR